MHTRIGIFEGFEFLLGSLPRPFEAPCLVTPRPVRSRAAEQSPESLVGEVTGIGRRRPDSRRPLRSQPSPKLLNAVPFQSRPGRCAAPNREVERQRAISVRNVKSRRAEGRPDRSWLEAGLDGRRSPLYDEVPGGARHEGREDRFSLRRRRLMRLKRPCKAGRPALSKRAPQLPARASYRASFDSRLAGFVSMPKYHERYRLTA